MVDAEGVITVSRRRANNQGKYNSREWGFQPRIMVTNSHEGLIRFLHVASTVGTVHHTDPANELWSRMWRWQVAGHDQCQHVARTIAPYLVIKRRQNAGVLAFPRMSRGGRRPADDDIYLRQLALYDEITALNRRGRHDRDVSEFPDDHPALTTDVSR